MNLTKKSFQWTTGILAVIVIALLIMNWKRMKKKVSEPATTEEKTT